MRRLLQQKVPFLRALHREYFPYNFRECVIAEFVAASEPVFLPDGMYRKHTEHELGQRQISDLSLQEYHVYHDNRNSAVRAGRRVMRLCHADIAHTDFVLCRDMFRIAQASAEHHAAILSLQDRHDTTHM